jgi:threonine/homoserine/homoserine lactone efflux protein
LEVITLLFIISSLIIIITPGQDMMLVISQSISHGKKAGIITALGVTCGLLVHTLLATIGLGSLLMASSWLFDFIKILGATYLIYIGYQLVFSKNAKLAIKALPKISYKKMFLQGAITNIMNPKIVIFYFSYLPLFVTFNAGNESLQLFILGITYAVLAFFVKAPIGFISGTLSFWIQLRPMVFQYINKTSGLILIGLGIKLATQQRD